MNLKRPVAAFLLAATPACMTTRRVVPAQYIPQYRPAEIVVFDEDGTGHLLQEPAIVGENVVGIEVLTADTLSLPVARVTEARVRQKSPAKTALLVGGLAAGVTLGFVAILTAGPGAPCTLGSNDSPGGPAQCAAP